MGLGKQTGWGFAILTKQAGFRTGKTQPSPRKNRNGIFPSGESSGAPLLCATISTFPGPFLVGVAPSGGG